MPHTVSPEGQSDTGLTCLVLVARFLGVAAEAEQLRHEFARTQEPVSSNELIRAARHLGLKARQVSSEWKKLEKTPLPALVKYRKLFTEVLIASFFLQLFALVTPLFFQVVIDKVLVHKGLTTLDVLAFGLIVVSVFEVLLGGLRTYVFSHTTNRVDVELGARLYRHLLSLPMSYFGARRVRDSIARVRELENVRNFITGSALTLVIDLLFTFVFLAVMTAYFGVPT